MAYEGDVLELTVNWLKPLTDIRFMHRTWLRDSDGFFSDFHPNFS